MKLPVFALTTLLALSLMPGCEACDAQPLSEVPQPGSISGRVCDPSGNGTGLYGARVFVGVTLSDGTVAERSTVTDGEGRFIIEDIPAGTYVVEVERGSFTQNVVDVVVEEEIETEINAECIEAREVSMVVFDGHDNVQDVLSRLGFTNFDVIPTFHRRQDRDEDTESWLITHFGNYENIADRDIIFINCGAHEWALEEADFDEVNDALENLRRFVREGGSLYMSDWSYDIFERLYPEAVEWVGDDTTRNDAEVGISQNFLGSIADATIEGDIGVARASLRYELGRIATPAELGAGSRALVTADIEIEGGEVLADTPVLFEHKPIDLPPNSDGRVIFTTFHNGEGNTEDMDAVLRAIVFSL